MKANKKTLVILAAIAALCLAGVAVSQFVDWNVDSESTSGNIGKSSRFSRKTAKDGASNMEELLQNDPEFKDGIVAAYLVMKTRAQQFNALVDMSVDAAGDIPAFETVLRAMKDAQPKIVNACASLEAAGNDLDAALGGETPKDLAQNTNNAVLAYGILQQQNSLANDFIDTTDAYLKTAAGDDRLKLVRDQWVQYQQLTAALAQDADATAVLEEKGYLLSPEMCGLTLRSFNEDCQVATLSNTALTGAMGFVAPLISFIAGDQGELCYALLKMHVAELSNSEVLRNSDAIQSSMILENAETVKNAESVKNAETAMNAVTVRNAEEAISAILVLSATSGLVNLRNATTDVMNNVVVDGMQLTPFTLQMHDALKAVTGEGAEVLNLI